MAHDGSDYSDTYAESHASVSNWQSLNTAREDVGTMHMLNYPNFTCTRKQNHLNTI